MPPYVFVHGRADGRACAPLEASVRREVDALRLQQLVLVLRLEQCVFKMRR